jgi:hypothetical protein
MLPLKCSRFLWFNIWDKIACIYIYMITAPSASHFLLPAILRDRCPKSNPKGHANTNAPRVLFADL